MKFLIGFTQPEPTSRTYHPMADGYFPGDYQVELVLTLPATVIENLFAGQPVELPEDFILTKVAEAVFEATNAPYSLCENTAGGFIQEALRDYQGYRRSLSVGDTVSYVADKLQAIHGAEDPNIEVISTVECAKTGWKHIDISANRNPISWAAYERLELTGSF